MAGDVVTNQVLFDGSLRRIIRLTSVSDATGETAIVKVDKSALIGPNNTAPGRLVVEKIEWAIGGMTNVQLKFDHTAPDMIATLANTGKIDLTDCGGIVDPNSDGGTGDITLTTVGADSGDTYDITLHLRKKA